MTVLPSLRPGPEPRPVQRRRERMTSLTDLRDVVDAVIGVDTHVNSHSAAAVDTATGGVLDEITVEATPEGYAELVEFANNHATLRAWAIEGTGGHGAGLSRHLAESSEIIIELDRPKRAARRNGAKSDPLDAIRAAREAMERPRLGTPRSGAERQALSVLLAARRSAVNASTEAQQQVFSLVIAAPEPIRARFRGQKLAAMLNTAANLRALIVGRGDNQHGRGAADLGSTRARDAEGGARAAEGDGGHHPQLAAGSARGVRRRPDRRSNGFVRLVPPWSNPLRGSVRDARRRGTHPRQQRPGHQPVSTQPLRRPPAQQRTAHRGPVPDPVPASHPRLRRPPHRRRQDQP